jgi:aminoglycoside phosphotransferase (APT) family kinase protein
MRSSCEIEELDVRLADGQSRRLLLKEVGPDALSADAARAKPAFLLDPNREITAYRDVIGPRGIDAPALLGSVADPLTGRFWLLLDLIEGEPLWQVGDRRVWEQTARWLAELHRAAPPAARVLLRYDEAWLRGWLARAVALAPAGSLDHVARGFDRVLTRLTAWPHALVHGEFYPSNVLVERRGNAMRLRVIDWEMAGVGPGLLDLAALTLGGWGEGEREHLAGVYYRTWSPGGQHASEAQLLEALEHARLAVALQWIGWSEDWVPPAAQAHDWLGEALAAAERLSL